MDQSLVELCDAQHWGLSGCDSITECIDFRLTASHSLEAGKGKYSQLLGQGDETLGARIDGVISAVSLGWRPVKQAVWGKR